MEVSSRDGTDGDYQDNSNRFTLMRREGKAEEEISFFNQP